MSLQSSLKQADRQAARDWSSYYESFVAEVAAESNETEAARKKRVAKLEADPEAWKQYYFPKYCSSPSAPFHKRATKREIENPEWYESRVWARELAKDVTEMMNTLYQTLALKQKKNILFISNSWDKAAELLEPYRINLTRNERIINDYGIQQNPGSWAYGDFVTTQGVSYLAVGADQSPRGSRNEEVRPDKVIVSDIDTDEDVRNSDIIKKRWDWFEKAVFPTRSVSKEFQVIFLGNLIAKDCCVARAMKMADYVDIVNLEDKNGNSTWPEKNTPENIARIKSKISTKAYQGEYMNNPLTEGTTFKKMTWGKCPPLHKLKYVVVYGDPAPGNNENKKNSSKACFIIGELEGRFYVYTGWLDQVGNEIFCGWFYDAELYVKGKTQIYNYIENNGLQNPFYEQVFLPLFRNLGERNQHHLPISPDNRQKPDKFARIEGNLEPVNRRGDLILNEDEKGNPHMQKLEEQFLLVNPQLSSPADGPDCIEGGVWILNNKKPEAASSITIGHKPRNRKRF
mgnify:FL=1